MGVKIKQAGVISLSLIHICAGQIVYDGPVSDVNEEILNNIYEGKLEQEVAG